MLNFPASATAPEVPETTAPITGASKVVPQVGQPLPSTASPATNALDSSPPACSAASASAAFLPLLYFAVKYTSATKADWKKVSRKFKKKSPKLFPTPNTPKTATPRIFSAPKRSLANISLNDANPLASRFNSAPKIINVAKNTATIRRFRIASKNPCPASPNSSSHFASLLTIFSTIT